MKTCPTAIDQIAVSDREPRQYLRQDGQACAQRRAHRAGAGSGGHQHARRAQVFLIRPDQPPVPVRPQSPDLPVGQERRSATLGLVYRREHRALAAYETALGIEQRDVTVADQVLGRRRCASVPDTTSKARPRSRPASSRAEWSGWS